MEMGEGVLSLMVWVKAGDKSSNIDVLVCRVNIFFKDVLVCRVNILSS